MTRPAGPPVLPPPARRTAGRRAAAVVALLGCAAAAAGLGYQRVRDARALEAAAAAEAAGDLPAAEAALAPLLARTPDDPEANFLAARVAWRRRLADAFPAGWDRPVRQRLAVALTAPWLVGRVSGDEDALAALAGDRAAAARLDRRAAAGGPDAVARLEALTRCHLDAHRLGDAMRAANRLVAAAPAHARGHFWRGLVTELAGRRSGEAGPDYRRAVELDPADPAFRLQLAVHLVGQNADLPEARRLLDALLRERPDDPDVLRPLGQLLAATADPAAREVLGRLLALRPDDAEALAQLGRAELEAGDLAAAERHLRAAVARAPESYVARFNLYRALAAAGRPAEAEPHKQAADRIRADRERIQALADAVVARPDDPAPRVELGRLYLRAGEDRLGVYWLETALEADPGDPAARAELAAHAERRRAGGRP